jgi:fumarate hydratase class II
MLMVCAQVIGNDTAVTVGGHSGGTFELNVAMPVMAHNILQSIALLSSSAINFATKCVDGIAPNTVRLGELAEASIAICTALAPKIGYDKSAKLAKIAFSTGRPLREVARKEAVLPDEELDQVLDLLRMTKPGLV